MSLSPPLKPTVTSAAPPIPAPPKIASAPKLSASLPSVVAFEAPIFQTKLQQFEFLSNKDFCKRYFLIILTILGITLISYGSAIITMLKGLPVSVFIKEDQLKCYSFLFLLWTTLLLLIGVSLLIVVLLIVFNPLRLFSGPLMWFLFICFILVIVFTVLIKIESDKVTCKNINFKIPTLWIPIIVDVMVLVIALCLFNIEFKPFLFNTVK